LAEARAAAVGAELIDVIGGMVMLYRASEQLRPEKQIRLPQVEAGEAQQGE